MAGANNKSLKKAGMTAAEIEHVRKGQTVIHSAEATAIQHSEKRRGAAVDFRAKAAAHMAAQRSLQEAARARKGALLAERQRRVAVSLRDVGKGMLAARRAAAKPKLATLSGSEKQVAWATDIRQKALAEIDAMPKGAGTQESADRYKRQVREVFARVQNARTWIDFGRSSGYYSRRVAAMARAEKLPIPAL